MVNPKYKYRTRDGRKAQVLTVNRNGGFPVVAMIEDDQIVMLLENGNVAHGKETPYDLIREPERHVHLARIYGPFGPVGIHIFYEDKEPVRVELVDLEGEA